MLLILQGRGSRAVHSVPEYGEEHKEGINDWD